jgi:hypothetical protein
MKLIYIYFDPRRGGVRGRPLHSNQPHMTLSLSTCITHYIVYGYYRRDNLGYMYLKVLGNDSL